MELPDTNKMEWNSISSAVHFATYAKQHM